MLKKLIYICLLLAVCGVGSAAAAADIRVALVSGQYTAEISCDDEFAVVDNITGAATIVPKGRYFLNAAEGRLTLDKFTFGRSIAIRGSEGKAAPEINKRRYAGQITASIDGDKLLVRNVVDLEEYVKSVLPAKTMPIWPDEAIKAQAVAARSYAWYMIAGSGGKAYDVAAMDKELSYQGINSEKTAISKFVQATAGQVLADGSGSPVMAVTTSSSGGRTESAAAALDIAYSYLPSVADYDSDSPDYTWDYSITPALLQNFLEQRGYAVGRLASVRLSPMDEPGSDRSATGRVRYITFSGDAGAVQITGSELKDMLSLNSTLFDVETGTPVPDTLKVPIENYYGMEIGSKDIDIKVNEDNKPVWKNLIRSYHLISGGREEKIIFHGRGKGSGVGLSMWGARGMANANGKTTYRQILSHYYPGTYITRL